MTWTNPVTPFVMFDHFAIIGHHATINGVTHTLIWEIRVSLLFPLIIVPICRWGMRGALCRLACLPGHYCGHADAVRKHQPMGDLLILSPHQSLAHKLAFELQWTCLLRLFFCLGSVLATRLQRDPLLL